MKRYGNLFHQAFSHDALLAAFYQARRSKRAKAACFQFECRLAWNLDQLHDEIHAGTYRPRPYHSFQVKEPKLRTIYAPAFRDVVVQHAVYAVILPIFERSFIDQSFACRVGKGTHKASDYAQRALQLSPPGSYLLQLDISKFFYSIDRGILISQLERKIKDKRLAAVMAMFLDHGEPVGIPIGNLLSQLYALIYLNDLDHFIKREMKARLYCRYVDDFILFGLTRSECEKALARITQFLRDKLRLGLSRATIAPVTRGVNFVGYRTWASKRFIRKRSMYNFRRAVKRQRLESIVSILGHAKHTHSQGALIRSLENHRGIRRELPKVYKHAAHCRAVGASAGG